jgi:TolB protein
MPCRFRMTTILISATLSTAAAQQAVPEVARQITHAVFDSPSLSPDGRQMVYIYVVAGREQLFIRSLDGKIDKQLTADSVDHEDPAWSPNGAQIAFVSLTKTTEQIAVIPAEGGATELLTPATERCIHPAWLPDGQHIGYCTDDDLAPPKKNDSDIKIFDLVTRTSRVLITGGVNTYPVWSPNGRFIAFRRMLGGTNSEVFVADSDGTNARNLTNSPAFDGWPAWSPDGRRLAFASNRDGDYQIHVMDADGSHVRLVVRTTGRATAPKWSPDGRTLYFPICRRVDGGFDCNIYAADAPIPQGQ